MRNIGIVLGIETTGLSATEDDIWEIAYLQIDLDTNEILESFSEQVLHNRALVDRLPDSLRELHDRRYDTTIALLRNEAANHLASILRFSPHIIGMNPAFDMMRIELFLRRFIPNYEPTWHHHLIDLEVMMFTSLPLEERKIPWQSDDLSRQIGIDPDAYLRHTAMGDVQWSFDVWKKLCHRYK
jgi:oligoribonuclease (3'-5' exoribonuclease)